jgi:hypothetical protein
MWGPFSGTQNTHGTRAKAYEETAEAISALGTFRSVEEVKTKAQKLKSAAKQRASNYNADKVIHLPNS